MQGVSSVEARFFYPLQKKFFGGDTNEMHTVRNRV